jgi:hypothetical protein
MTLEDFTPLETSLLTGDTADGGLKPLSEEDRQRKVRSLREQLLEFEMPHERLWEMVVGQPSLIATIKICLDINLFGLWAEVCGCTLADEELTLTELGWLVKVEIATMSKLGHHRVDRPIADATTAGRVLRHLTSYGVIREVNTETYAQTTLSKALCDPLTRAGIIY